MLRRDYILRMIEEFAQALARLRSLKKEEEWDEAAALADKEFQQLLGTDARTLARLSETELLARIVQGVPTQAVREKTLMLTTLLKETGDIAVALGDNEEGRNCHLKGLNLLLTTLGNADAFECPAFVPKVELFVSQLQDSPLPFATQARLMEHYERAGDYGKAEDRLFAMLDEEPGNQPLLEFGIAFYRRLAGHTDTALAEGNLPRIELDSGLTELEVRKAGLNN